MSYTYGMKGAPAVGKGLGGLPKRNNAPDRIDESTFTRIVTAGSGVINPPTNAKYMRVAVIGAGGSNTGSVGASGGSGGGGCAASKIVPAASIVYTVGAAVGTGNGKGQDSTAVFPGYSLVGGGGNGCLPPNPALGGVGSGGDYNFTGGQAFSGTFQSGNGRSGGGAAGPNGNGGNGNSDVPGSGSAGQFAGTGWGVGGGGGGGSEDAAARAGGGTGAAGAPFASSIIGPAGGSTFGTAAVASTAGLMGGGSGGDSPNIRLGGVGGIVVEWFYD